MNEYIKAMHAKPGHVEQVKSAVTMDEMRKELFRMSFHSPMVRSAFDSAKYAGLSGEDTYAMLSYSILSVYQKLYAAHVMDYLCKVPPQILTPTNKEARDELQPIRAKIVDNLLDVIEAAEP